MSSAKRVVINIPDKLCISNAPTPIHRLDALNPDPDWATLYIKRDDFTGFETSGNKVRRSDYYLCDAMKKGAGVIITCGSLQSNHARATASVSARFSFKCHLVLQGSADTPPDGNYFLSRLFGAKITLVTPEKYENRDEIMREIGERYRSEGCVPYIIPAGGSDGLGMFGYYEVYHEILRQEREMGVRFDSICFADGSGGTYAGLYAANELCCGGKNIVGFNVTGREYAREKVLWVLEEGLALGGVRCRVSERNIYQNFDYLGPGYGIVYPELTEQIRITARRTGIVVDLVYTGKSLLGTVSEIAGHNPRLRGNVLYIHTGGQFGIFPYKELFS